MCYIVTRLPRKHPSTNLGNSHLQQTSKPMLVIENVWPGFLTEFFFRILSHLYVGVDVSYEMPSLNSVLRFLP